MTLTIPPARTAPAPETHEVVRYSLLDRVIHWVVGVTFVYLLLSGLALAYPRLAWIMTWLGGGQTVRALHPVVGVVFSLGLLLMVFAWARDMRFGPGDREWLRRMRSYARTGHAGLDVGRYNAGQKGYYWFILVFGFGLLLTGIPLWFPGTFDSRGLQEVARLLHHLAYLAMLAGFIVHVYMTTVMLPGTISAMTSGRVSRRWAAWHHPRWLREKEGATR